MHLQDLEPVISDMHTNVKGFIKQYTLWMFNSATILLSNIKQVMQSDTAIAMNTVIIYTMCFSIIFFYASH